jgi:hypothetical protein
MLDPRTGHLPLDEAVQSETRALLDQMQEHVAWSSDFYRTPAFDYPEDAFDNEGCPEHTFDQSKGRGSFQAERHSDSAWGRDQGGPRGSRAQGCPEGGQAGQQAGAKVCKPPADPYDESCRQLRLATGLMLCCCAAMLITTWWTARRR